ncbi:alpha/beta-hydrolase family protein [Rhodococcus sp. O3]|uniref:alpha/beta-hydrolase family protein n=1 Tax=Rhodococcus sp. O3 TaxID=3404919 RepID=UPI003B675F63
MSTAILELTRPHHLSIYVSPVACPRVATTTATTVAVCISSAPSLLPRPAVVQAVVTAVSVLCGLGLLAAARALGARFRPTPPVASVPVRWGAVGAAIGLCGAATLAADRWQNGLRDAMGVHPVGAAHWALVATAATLIVALALGVTARIRRIGPVRALAAAGIIALAGYTAATGFAPTAAASLPPSRLPAGVSGAPQSLVPWDTLGEQGRRFVALDTAGDAIRTYVGVDSAPDAPARAALAVRELDRAGGFDRGHLVVAVPTGSGWIDANAVAGFESAYGDDVAFVAVQYSSAPSWVTFVLDRDAAIDAATALVDAVRSRLDTFAPADRPQLHVYGQSLGAVGAGAAFDGPAAPGPCDALWTGPPAGSVRPDGGTVLANSSDPVIRWRPSLLWSPPDLSRARVDAPLPAWLPVIGFLQTSVDLLFALDAAPGHGHRYGPDQARCAS